MKLKILHISKDISGGIGTVIKMLLDVFNNSKNIFIDNGYKSFFKSFKNESNKYNVLHFHGAWTLHLLPLFNKLKKPTLISPHGAFHPISLEKSKLKKLIAKYLYMKRCYQNVDCIHALTEQEAKDIRNYGLKKNPIAIIPNGINFEEEIKINEKKKKEWLNLANSRKILLSLSRLHSAKGIDMLIDAFAELQKISDNNVLFIAGAGDEVYTKKLQNKIIKNKLQNSVFLVGEQVGILKNTLYDIADIFILPSYNEGFPLTVLEAYRQYVPVITTNATPFSDIQRLACGWYVKPTMNEILGALKKANALTSNELSEKGIVGYEWMKENYSLETIKIQYEQMYLWLLGESDKPEFMYEK